MARTRMLKPEFFRSRSLARVSRDARLTFQGLWVCADAAGRGLAHTVILKGDIWPLEDDITPGVIAEHLAELEREHIILYQDGEDTLYAIRNWEKHQSASYRTGDAKYPAPPEPGEVVQLAPPVVQPARQPVHKGVHKEKGSEGKEIADRLPISTPARNEVWEALSRQFGEPSTKTEKSNRGRQVKELIEAGADAQAVARRIEEHRRRRLHWTLTANSLVTHWTELAPTGKDGDTDTAKMTSDGILLSKASW